LELHSLSQNDFGGENSSSLTRALAASNRIAPMASHTAIDQCVWRIGGSHLYRDGTRFPSSAYFSLIQDREGSNKSVFLPFVCRLRFFEIHIDLGRANRRNFDVLSSMIASLCISLTSPAILEHLKFNFWFGGYDRLFNIYTIYGNLRDVWSHLDSIATHPTGSRLQRVDININYFFDLLKEPDEEEVVKAVFDCLPLLRTKGILFVEAVVGE
jgi:hypothetical protein